MAASWEGKAQALGLDDRTFQALQGVPSERAHQILDEVGSKTTEVRNPSAFVSKAAREAWDDPETLRRCLEGSSWKDVLDDKAKEELLHGADPAAAFTLLEDLRTKRDDIRNPSSYVCSTMKKRAAEHQMRGGMARPHPGALGSFAAAHATPPSAHAAMAPLRLSVPSAFNMSAPMYAAQSMRAGVSASYPVLRMPSASPPMAPPTREPTAEEKAEIDQAVAELAPDLDQRAVDKIYQLASPALARSALEALAAKPDVRNKSAFLNGIVSRRLQEAAEVGVAEREQSEVDAKLQKWEKDLDDGAKNILMELREKLGTVAMLEVLKELEAKVEKGELRNVSSFVFSMAKQRISSLGGGMPNMGYMAQQSMVQNYMPMPQMAPVQLRSPVMYSAMQRTAPIARAPVVSTRPAAANSARWVQDQVARFGLQGNLDDVVLVAMESADPDRVTEILEELATREDVRNPSAFVSKSLRDFPSSRKRTLAGGMGMGGGGPMSGGLSMSAGLLGGLGGSMSDGGWNGGAAAKRPRTSGGGEQTSGSYAHIMQRMDPAAQARLREHPDQNRVQEILKEMASFDGEIRNPSAFVVRALNTNKT